MIALLLLVIFCTGDVRVGAVMSCILDHISNDTRNMYIDNVTLVYFIGNENITKPLINASQIVTDSRFNKSSPCVLYMHDYRAVLGQGSTKKIITAYNNKPETCFMAVNWTQLANADFFISLATLFPLALKVAKAMDDMLNNGLKLTGLVGHGLGAHGSGYICRNMNHTCKSIVGLDPTSSFITGPICNAPLNYADADCVPILHTNDQVFGSTQQFGTTDFYANSGRVQPGCSSNADNEDGESRQGCSHIRAVSIWAEQVSTPNSFQGIQYTSALLKAHLARNEIILNLGECNSTRPTRYDFTTNSVSPYGRGRRGF